MVSNSRKRERRETQSRELRRNDTISAVILAGSFPRLM
ncbi:hypothetical protein ABIC10_008383 [Bradyrhizobium sp. S3.2.12]